MNSDRDVSSPPRGRGRRPSVRRAGATAQDPRRHRCSRPARHPSADTGQRQRRAECPSRAGRGAEPDQPLNADKVYDADWQRTDLRKVGSRQSCRATAVASAGSPMTGPAIGNAGASRQCSTASKTFSHRHTIRQARPELRLCPRSNHRHRVPVLRVQILTRPLQKSNSRPREVYSAAQNYPANPSATRRVDKRD